MSCLTDRFIHSFICPIDIDANLVFSLIDFVQILRNLFYLSIFFLILIIINSTKRKKRKSQRIFASRLSLCWFSENNGRI